MKMPRLVAATLLFAGGLWALSAVSVPPSLANPKGGVFFSPYASMTIENVDTATGVVPAGWPVDRRGAVVSSEFGRRRHPIYKVVRPHNGIDFAVPKGSPVRATAEGVVVFAGTAVHYGEIVKIWHEGDYHTFYAHNEGLEVRTGDRVRRGELIARSGKSGLATGPHLHYEVRKRGTPQNPRHYMD